MRDKRSFGKLGKTFLYSIMGMWLVLYVLSGFVEPTEQTYADPSPTQQQSQPQPQSTTNQAPPPEESEGFGITEIYNQIEEVAKTVTGIPKAVQNYVSQIEKGIAEDIETFGNNQVSKAKDAFIEALTGKKPSANKNECQPLDLGCEVKRVIITFTLDLMNELRAIFVDMIFRPDWMFKSDPVLQSFFNAFNQLAWSFVTLFVIFHGIRLLAMSQLGDNSADIKFTIQKLLISAVLISQLQNIFSLLIALNSKLLLGFLNIKDQLDTSLAGILKIMGLSVLASKAGSPGLIITTPINVVFLLLGAGFVIAVFIVALQLLLRQAELVLLMILGPVAIATNMNERYNYFHYWWKQLLVTIFSQSIQLMMLQLTLLMTTTIQFGTAFSKLALALGFVYFTIKSPAFLKEWMHSSESSSLTMGIIQKTVETTKQVATAAAKAA